MVLNTLYVMIGQLMEQLQNNFGRCQIDFLEIYIVWMMLSVLENIRQSLNLWTTPEKYSMWLLHWDNKK